MVAESLEIIFWAPSDSVWDRRRCRHDNGSGTRGFPDVPAAGPGRRRGVGASAAPFHTKRSSSLKTNRLKSLFVFPDPLAANFKNKWKTMWAIFLLLGRVTATSHVSPANYFKAWKTAWREPGEGVLETARFFTPVPVNRRQGGRSGF